MSDLTRAQVQQLHSFILKARNSLDDDLTAAIAGVGEAIGYIESVNPEAEVIAALAEWQYLIEEYDEDDSYAVDLRQNYLAIVGMTALDLGFFSAVEEPILI